MDVTSLSLDRNEDSFKHKTPVYDSVQPRKPIYSIKLGKPDARVKELMKHLRIKSQP